MINANTRPDFSEYLAHFTKTSRSGGKLITATDRLVSILTSGTINAGSLPWTKRPAVCFTECPWSSLLSHAKQYSAFGIGFKKPTIFAHGGGPAYYVRADHFFHQKWDPSIYSFVTPFWPSYRPTTIPNPIGPTGKPALAGKSIDYSHEREWRIPQDFSFSPPDVEFVILPDYKTMAAIPSKLKDAIGRDKFLLLEMYRAVERLWPVHNL
jgi:hypothetical protein